MSYFPFGVQYYKDPEIAAVRNHSIFYLLFEDYTEEQLAENGNLTVNLIRTSNIYEIYANTETLIYFLYKTVNTNPAYINLFKTLIQILIITSYIINTPYLLSSTYVFDKDDHRKINPDNSDIEEITNILLGDKQFGYFHVYNFVDYLFSKVHMSVEYGILGGYFSQNIRETLYIYQTHLSEISEFVNNFYTLLFPAGNESVVVAMLYNHLSNIFNYTFTEEKETEEENEQEIKKEQERKDLFIQYMMYILSSNEQILPWYLAALGAHNDKLMVEAERISATPPPQFITFSQAASWFEQKINETTSEPNLWNAVTRGEFAMYLNEIFTNLKGSNMHVLQFQELQNQYEKITTSFQDIRRLGMYMSNEGIKQHAIQISSPQALNISIEQLFQILSMLDTITIENIIGAGVYFSPLLIQIDNAIKSQQDAPGLAIIAHYEPTDLANVGEEEKAIQQFVVATAPKGGKKIKNIKINTKNKKTKKQYKKIIKKQSTKMIKKPHKKNKKTTRKTNNKK